MKENKAGHWAGNGVIKRSGKTSKRKCHNISNPENRQNGDATARNKNIEKVTQFGRVQRKWGVLFQVQQGCVKSRISTQKCQDIHTEMSGY